MESKELLFQVSDSLLHRLKVEGKDDALSIDIIGEVLEEYNKLRFEDAIKEIEGLSGKSKIIIHPDDVYKIVIEILKSKL